MHSIYYINLILISPFTSKPDIYYFLSKLNSCCVIVHSVALIRILQYIDIRRWEWQPGAKKSYPG